MNKRKIAGLILFTLLIGGILLYPSIKDRIEDQIFRYRVQSALKSEEYQRVRELVLDNGVMDGFGWDYLALLEAEINLGRDLNPHINKLLMHGQLDILQYIVDRLGYDVHQYIILATIDGLIIDEQLRYELANMQIMIPPYYYGYPEAIERAMEIRGPRETIDNIYLRYLIQNGEIEQALKLYEEMADKYKMDVLDALIPILVRQTFYNSHFHPFTHEEMLENIDKLSSLGLSDEMFRLFLREAMLFNIGNDYIQTNIDKYPYFTENLYYRYYSNLRKLTSYPIKNHRNVSYERVLEEVIKDLKRDEFKAIPETEDIIAVLESSEKVHSFLTVNKNGSIFYYDGDDSDKGTFNTYNTHTEERSEFSFGDMLEIDTISYDKLHFSHSSVGRDYYLALSLVLEEDSEIEWSWRADFYHLLLDSEFNLLDASELTSREVQQRDWLNKISNIVGDKKFYNPYSFNAGPITRSVVYEDVADFFVSLDVPGIQYYHLYNMDEETYTIIQYKHDVHQLVVHYTYYSVFNKDTHELLYQVDLRQFDGLLGSCDKNLYVASILEDTLLVLEVVDKRTLERTRLPFYSIETGNPRHGGSIHSKFYRDHIFRGGY